MPSRVLVLGPIGMTHSSFSQPLTPKLMKLAASPHTAAGSPVAGGPHTYPELAAAGLWTTPSDLALYAIEVQNALAGKSSRVINQSLAREMLRPGLNGWGLGPQTGGEPGRRYFQHSGGNAGFTCNLVAYDRGDGLIVMTNGDGGSDLIAEITRTVAAEYQWWDFGPKLRPSRPSPLL